MPNLFDLIANDEGLQKLVQGLQEGLAGAARGLTTDAVGAPVDIINSALGAVGVPVSKQPVGGSEWMRSMLDQPTEDSPQALAGNLLSTLFNPGLATKVPLLAMTAGKPLLNLYHGGRLKDKWDPVTMGTGEGRGFAQGPGLYAGDTEQLARVYLKYGGDSPQLTKLLVDDSRIFNPAKKMSDEHRQAYQKAEAQLDLMGLKASNYGVRNALNMGRYYDPQKIRQLFVDSGIGGFRQHLNSDFGDEFVIFDPSIIKEYHKLPKK